jgi:hypothetical protein
MASLGSNAPDRGTVLRFMREVLAEITERSPRYSDLVNSTFRKLVAAGFVSGPFERYEQIANEHPLSVLLTEAYGQLLAFGYIVPLPSKPNAPNPNWLMITDIGRQWASGSHPIPEDPTGYMGALDTLIPGIDDVIRQQAYACDSSRSPDDAICRRRHGAEAQDVVAT